MTEPVVCTLPPAELPRRTGDWQALVNGGRARVTRVPAGLRLSVEPEAAAELDRLVELERECCRWMSFVRDPSGVTLSAPPDAAAVIAATLGLDPDG